MVAHDAVLKLLKTYDILDQTDLKILEFLLNNSAIEIEEQIFMIGRGVPQGSIISPFLFDIFFESMYQKLKYSRNLKERFFSFADDLAIIFVNNNDLK